MHAVVTLKVHLYRLYKDSEIMKCRYLPGCLDFYIYTFQFYSKVHCQARDLRACEASPVLEEKTDLPSISEESREVQGRVSFTICCASLGAIQNQELS